MNPFDSQFPTDDNHPFNPLIRTMAHFSAEAGYDREADFFTVHVTRMMCNPANPRATAAFISASLSAINHHAEAVAYLLNHDHMIKDDPETVNGIKRLLGDLSFHSILQIELKRCLQDARRKSGVQWEDFVMDAIRGVQSNVDLAQKSAALLSLQSVRKNVMPKMPTSIREHILEQAGVPAAEHADYDDCFTDDGPSSNDSRPDSWI
jgi:hypothetical protein